MFRRNQLSRRTRTAIGLLGVSCVVQLAWSGVALAETTPPQPAAAQPTLPSTNQAAPPDSPVVEDIVKAQRPAQAARKAATRRTVSRARRTARRHDPTRELDRPALAGVELVEPLPPPPEPPHFIVPMPAFPLESVAAAYFTPPPPIVCHPTRRDPSQPDPRLYKEQPVECEPDNP